MKLYFIVSGEFVKVGLANDVAERIEALRIGDPHPMIVAAWRTIPATLARPIEKAVHVALRGHAHFGEWFRTDAKTAIAMAKPIIAHALRAHQELRRMDVEDRLCARERALEEIEKEKQALAGA